MKRLPHDQYIELAVIMTFIRYTQLEIDMCTFFVFGLSAIRPRDAVRPRPVWAYFKAAFPFMRTFYLADFVRVTNWDQTFFNVGVFFCADFCMIIYPYRNPHRRKHQL